MRSLKWSITVILTGILFVLTGCSSSSKDVKADYKIKAGEDITFYITSDLHYLSDSLTDKGEAFQKYVSSGNGTQLNYIDEILNAFIYEINSKKPDVLIISGDLTNNGEKKSHMDLARKLDEIEKSGTIVYVIPGNHDIFNPWARGFKEDKQYVTEGISDKEFSQIYKSFGYDEAISRDKNSLSYLVAPSEKLWLLMLDTNKYKNNFTVGYPQADGELSKDTLDWIKKSIALAKENGASIIPVMHHSILNHSDVIQKGYTLNNNIETLGTFRKGNISLVFSGHIHIQDICSDKDSSEFYNIASGALTVYPHQYGILNYSAAQASLEYGTSIVDVENWSKEIGINEKNLNNFRAYSEEYFGSFAYKMAKKQLMMEELHSDSEIESMAETMKTLNLRYFAGRESLNSNDVMNSEGYKLWINSPYSRFYKYVLSISRDGDIDDNNLKLNIKRN